MKADFKFNAELNSLGNYLKIGFLRQKTILPLILVFKLFFFSVFVFLKFSDKKISFQNVTYNGILKAILILWASAFMLVLMPFVGFGLYFDTKSKCCMRYRLATKPVDVAYAYVFFAYGKQQSRLLSAGRMLWLIFLILGLLLCFGISCANLSVTKYLCTSSRTQRGIAGHRISRTLKRQQSSMRMQCISASTPGEIAFARLMVALSISFLICWMPQLVGKIMSRVIVCPFRNAKFWLTF